MAAVAVVHDNMNPIPELTPSLLLERISVLSELGFCIDVLKSSVIINPAFANVDPFSSKIQKIPSDLHVNAAHVTTLIAEPFDELKEIDDTTGVQLYRVLPSNTPYLT